MNVTEVEAAQKFCPQSLINGTGSTFVCSSVGCMAWRWAKDIDGSVLYQRKSIEGQPGMYENAPMGYCGLAGVPNL